MLVLTRKAGESIAIGDDIVIKIVEIDRGRIRIGIECPKETKVLRTELVRRDQRENRQANPAASDGASAAGGAPGQG